MLVESDCMSGSRVLDFAEYYCILGAGIYWSPSICNGSLHAAVDFLK